MEKKKRSYIIKMIIGCIACLSLLCIPSFLVNASEKNEEVVQNQEITKKDSKLQEQVEKQKHGSALGFVFGVIIAVTIIFGTIFATKEKRKE